VATKYPHESSLNQCFIFDYFPISHLAYFCYEDRINLNKLFAFRPAVLFVIMIGAMNPANAQLVDQILGQRRSMVHAIMRPYKIVDYKKERVVHNIKPRVHQTVMYENDTCNRFYWAVGESELGWFKNQLAEGGYKPTTNAGFVKDSLVLIVRKLSSGKATMFVASLDKKKLVGKREASGKKIVDLKGPNLEPLPLLQQAILAEDAAKKKDTLKVKKPKDPKRHWVTDKYGKSTILGWDLD